MKNKKVEKPTKKAKSSANQYTIDLDIKGMIFFVFLSLLTAVVIFYLGVLFGKASRNPNLVPTQVTEKTPPGFIEDKKISAKDLEIYNIKNNDDVDISALKKNSQSIMNKADEVLNQSEQTDPVESIPSTTSAQTQTPETRPNQSSSWPEQTSPEVLPDDTYTVQVFATKDKDKADRIVRLLRQQSFDAYLTQVTIENQVIHRVRVGKKSKNEIERVNDDLQKVIGGMGMKSRIIKIN